MAELIMAALVGLTLGAISSLFVRSKRVMAKLMVVLTGIVGALIFTLVAMALELALPVPAIAAAGAAALLALRLLFRKPSAGHRSFM